MVFSTFGTADSGCSSPFPFFWLLSSTPAHMISTWQCCQPAGNKSWLKCCGCCKAVQQSQDNTRQTCRTAPNVSPLLPNLGMHAAGSAPVALNAALCKVDSFSNACSAP